MKLVKNDGKLTFLITSNEVGQKWNGKFGWGYNHKSENCASPKIMEVKKSLESTIFW